MNIFFYFIIFVIGTLFGSFYTLAVHRIPKKQDIIHTHSYCPNCNHKLGFFDLFPIFSYLFLKGKCRYCKNKIRPRYLILEILSGILFLTLAILIKLNINTLTIGKIIEFSFMILYFTCIIILAGIDKENIKIEKSVIVYGIVISIMYMLYLCIVEKTNIYRYSIYLFFYIIVLIIDTVTLKKFAKDNYTIGILYMIIIMSIFTGEYVTINSIIYTLLIIFFYLTICKLKERNRKHRKNNMQISNKMNIGFYLVVANIITLIVVLFVSNYKFNL